jgi:hypothetical protein
MVKKLSIYMFLITFLLLPSSPLVAKQKTLAEGDTLEILFVDPDRSINSDEVQEPIVEGSGKIANISGYTLELVPPDNKDKNPKDSLESYIAISETRFLDVKGDEIVKETFQVGDMVSIVYKQYSRYLVELRKAEVLDPMRGSKKSSTPSTDSKSIDNKPIKLERGVYTN